MQYYGASVSADITCDNFNQAHLRMRKAGPATHNNTKQLQQPHVAWVGSLCCVDRGSSPLPDHVNTNFVMRLSKFQLKDILYTDNIEFEVDIAFRHFA